MFVYGLEIPVKYKFIGPEKAIIWMKTQVNKKVNYIVKKTGHCMSYENVFSMLYMHFILYVGMKIMLKKKEKTYKILYRTDFYPCYFRGKFHFVPRISVRFNEVSALCVSAL